MKKIWIAWTLIRMQKILWLFLAFMLLFSIYYLSPVCYQAIHYRNISEALEDFDTERGIYLYTGITWNRNITQMKELLDEKIEENSAIQEKAELIRISGADGRPIYIYNDTLIKKYRPSHIEGRWFRKEDKKDIGTTVKVIAAKRTDWKVGDLFEMTIQADKEAVPVSCEVIGVLDGDIAPSFDKAADNEVFQSDALFSEEPALILCESDMVRKREICKAGVKSNGCILYVKPETDFTEIQNEFGWYGKILDLDKGQNRFKEESKRTAGAMGVYCIVYLLLTFLCLITVNIISAVKNQPLYTVYHLCGMSEKEKIWTECVKAAGLFITGLSVSIIFLVSSGIRAVFFPNISMVYLILAMAFGLLAVFVPVSVWFMYRGRKQEIMESIRKQV